MTAAPFGGLEHPGVLDAMIRDNDKVVLLMTESRPWNAGDEQLFQLQEKINAYLSFALDGEFTESFAHLSHLPLCIRLECFEYPNPEVVGFLSDVREQIAFQGIDLEVIVREGAPKGECGSGCGCACASPDAAQADETAESSRVESGAAAIVS